MVKKEPTRACFGYEKRHGCDVEILSIEGYGQVKVIGSARWTDGCMTSTRNSTCPRSFNKMNRWSPMESTDGFELVLGQITCH